MSTGQLYDRIKAITDIDIDTMDFYTKEGLTSKITSMLFFIKSIEPLLIKIKNDLSKYLMSKQRSIQAYGEMLKFTDRYENLNMQHYSDMDATQLIFHNPSNEDLRISLQQAGMSLRNPYIDLYHWIKGELYDIEAMRNAIQARTNTMEKLRMLEGKKRDTQKDLESVSTGKTTVTTLFKNSNDTGAMANKIDQHEREIISSQQLVDLLSAYLGDKVIPAFKKEKLALYQRILQQFTVIEI